MTDISKNNTEEDGLFLGGFRVPPLEDILASMRHDFHVQGMSDKEIFERTTVAIDYATGEETTFKACIDKYGKELALELLRVKKGKKELEPEVLQQVKDIHRGDRLALKDKDQKAVQKGKLKPKSNNGFPQFVPILFEVMDNPEFKKLFKGKYLTYAFLRRYIIREQVGFDKLNLYENHYLKGELASSWSIGKMAKHFGCAPNTIRNHIEKLEENGCIKKVPVPAKDAWDNQEHSIYIFGTHDGNRNEKYFIDNVFGMAPIHEGQGVQ